MGENGRVLNGRGAFPYVEALFFLFLSLSHNPIIPRDSRTIGFGQFIEVNGLGLVFFFFFFGNLEKGIKLKQRRNYNWARTKPGVIKTIKVRNIGAKQTGGRGGEIQKIKKHLYTKVSKSICTGIRFTVAMPHFDLGNSRNQQSAICHNRGVRCIGGPRIVH